MTSERIVPLSEYHRLPQATKTSDFYKRLFEVVCNNATLALFIMDEHQQCVYMNPAAETLTGFSLAETQGRTLHDVIHHTHPDGSPYPLSECPIDRAFPQNNQEQGEEVFVHKDGHFYPVAYTASPIREDDHVVGTIIEVRDITQEKLAEQVRQDALRREQALRAEAEAAQQQTTHLLERMTDAFVVVDSDWQIVYMNTEAERLNNKPRFQVLGKTHWEEWPASVGTNVEYQYRRAMAEQVPVHFEHHYYSPPDYDVWLEIHAYPSLSGLGIFYRNISDRKQSEEALRRSEERFRVSQDLSLDAFTILDSLRDETGAIVDFVWTYVNPKAAEILQHSVEDLVGQRLLEVLPGNQLNSELFERYVRVVETGKPHDIELSYNADGITGWFRNMTVKLEDGIAIFFSDISDRKQTEVALRQSEERYRYLIEVTPQLVWTADAQGRNSFVSQQMCDYTGLSSDQLMNLNWQVLIHPDDSDRIDRCWQESWQMGTPYEAEYRFCRADGAYRWHLVRAIPVRDEQGQIMQWFGVSTDIHDKQELEQQRLQLLQQTQIAKEEAERANRIKDEFLAVLSHELRSPLNPILGWAKLLQTRKLDESRTQQALSTIERNAKLQSELIEDLLDVSRILRGKLKLTIAPVPFASTIQAALETVRLAAEAKSIDLQFIICDPGCAVDQSHNLKSLELATPSSQSKFVVLGDSTRLQQVVWNLLSNAVKFTSAGGRVAVKLVIDQDADVALPNPASDAKRYILMTITDNGKGILPSFLPYVFDYFRQEDSATTRQFGGLGLGLAIVRYLVELHGGTIQADSTGEGLGSTFTVRLPLMSNQSSICPNSHLSQSPLNLNGVQVLVVDDDNDTKDFIEFLLDQAGAKVVTVSRASEALTALRGFKPDVILSDIGMPEVDGYMLMQQVRALPPEAGGQIKAIALTAYAGEFDQQRALAVGFQQHISKPVEPETLLRAIVTLLEQSTANEASL